MACNKKHVAMKHLDGERSSVFSIEQGVAQGCTVSPTYIYCFQYFDLLRRVKGAEV